VNHPWTTTESKRPTPSAARPPSGLQGFAALVNLTDEQGQLASQAQAVLFLEGNRRRVDHVP